MEFSLEKWISELETNDYDYIDNFCNEFINPLNDFAPGDENLQQSSPSSDDNYAYNNYSNNNNNSSHPLNLQCDGCNASPITATAAAFITAGSTEEICHETTSVDDEQRPTKQIKTNTQTHISIYHSDASPPPAASPSTKPPQLLENTGLVPGGDINSNNAPKAGQKRPNPITRTPAEAQDRVMAERKRREKLSERFIALSSMVPGLKKMDKASVLGDAIKYLKQLQDHVKLLEKQVNKKSKESVVFLKKSQLSADDDDDDSSRCEQDFAGVFKEEEALPAIEARISENNVLIKIHCKKQKGFAAKLLNEIENLKLSVVNSSFLPFGQHAMDITVVAQMDDEICTTGKDFVKKLRGAFMKSM